MYKLGNTYYAARSNEFGYVNYESIDKPPVFFSPLSREQMESTKNQADYLHAQTVRELEPLRRARSRKPFAQHHRLATVNCGGLTGA